MKILALIILFIIPSLALADDLNRLEAGAAVALAAADTAVTCRNLANGDHEFSLPTQRCGGVAAILLGQVAVEALAAHLLRRHRIKYFAWLPSMIVNAQGLHFSLTH